MQNITRDYNAFVKKIKTLKFTIIFIDHIKLEKFLKYSVWVFGLALKPLENYATYLTKLANSTRSKTSSTPYFNLKRKC